MLTGSQRIDRILGMKKAHFGIDAPGVVITLFLSGLAELLLAWMLVKVPLLSAFLFLGGIILLAEAFWMIYSSRKGKLIVARQLISKMQLSHTHHVLDVGCGRGLMTILAAKVLKEGQVCGIDIWNRKDLSGNQLENVQKNIHTEGVEHCAEVRDGDMRDIPFPEESFDRVVASLAIHNLKKKEERLKALSEIDRVLQPGGVVGILDFQKIMEYREFFSRGYSVEVGPLNWRMFPPTRILIAVKNPLVAGPSSGH